MDDFVVGAVAIIALILGCMAVIFLYQPPKDPPRIEYWHVYVSQRRDHVLVQAIKDDNCCTTYHADDIKFEVYPPTDEEAARGVTYKDLVETACKECQDACDRVNAFEKYAQFDGLDDVKKEWGP